MMKHALLTHISLPYIFTLYTFPEYTAPSKSALARKALEILTTKGFHYSLSGLRTRAKYLPSRFFRFEKTKSGDIVRLTQDGIDLVEGRIPFRVRAQREKKGDQFINQFFQKPIENMVMEEIHPPISCMALSLTEGEIEH